MIQRIGYREVDLTASTIQTSNAEARQQDVNANIDDLAQSIELQGLFSPVLLIDLGDGKYELIAGQRRTQAYRKLAEKNPTKFCKIPAFIYENSMEGWEKKAMSVNKNLNRELLSEADRIAAVTTCYNQFDDIAITSQKTGISIDKVRIYVRYERLPQVLKSLHDDGDITLDAAVSTANLFGLDNPDIKDVSKKEIKDAAIKIQKLTSEQRKQLLKARAEDPQEPVSNLIKIMQNIRQPRSITAEVTANTYCRIKHYASNVTKKSVDVAAGELVEKGLESSSDIMRSV